MIYALHFSISSKTPFILEGEYRQGKKSVLEYYANQLWLELIQFSISKSKKVDDLLCKTTIKKNDKGNFSLNIQKFLYVILCVDNFPKKLEVRINNDTPAIL